MNLEIDFFLIIFILLIIVLTVYYPISGYYEIKKLKKSIADGEKSKKNKFYRETIFWSWLPLIFIFLLIPISGVRFDDIGIKWINIYDSSLSKWIIYPAIGFYFVYLFYIIYSIIVFKFNKEIRAKTARGIQDDYKWLLPITKAEKHTWSFVSISAGITEEILYRGYLFYALAIFFPTLSVIYILFISTLIFGIGHIYLGKEAIKSTLLGLFFGFFYILFDSVIPVIILHIAQDLVMRDILEEDVEE